MKHIVTVSLLLLAGGFAYGQDRPARRDPAPGHWPQWRGADRNNLSSETGLLREWPEGGPRLLWKTTDLGSGVGDVAIAGGLVFLMGYKADAEYLSALDGAGKVVWSQRTGPLVGEQSIMRWLSQRTPVVDDDRVYAFTADGLLLCLSSATGEIRWTKSYVRDWQGARAAWGFCDFPLVNQDLLICTPGGPKNTVIALEKKTGALKWSCSIPTSKQGSHSALFLTELAGVRQYVQQLDAGTVGIAEKDGTLLWSYPLEYRMGNVHCAVPVGADQVFTLSGWSIGGALLQIEKKGDALSAVERYMKKFSFDPWIGSTLKVGNRLFACQGTSHCIDLESGTVLFSQRLPGNHPTVTWAEGLFYVRSDKGQVLLLEATESEFKTLCHFETAVGREPAWTFPVVAGGHLYLRDQGDLSCYDLRGPKYQEPPAVWNILGTVPSKPRIADPRPPPKPLSDAVFVATPQDVVERMLETAKVKHDDVVYDLGSGDGRIVITAFKNYGCKAVGIENSPELVRLSRTKISEGKIDSWVRIEEKDLFTADFTGASVVTLYLGAPNNARLLPQLSKLKPGARIVSHQHLLGDAGPKPDVTLTMTSNEDGVEHTIHVWTTPLKVPEEKK